MKDHTAHTHTDEYRDHEFSVLLLGYPRPSGGANWLYEVSVHLDSGLLGKRPIKSDGSYESKDAAQIAGIECAKHLIDGLIKSSD